MTEPCEGSIVAKLDDDGKLVCNRCTHPVKFDLELPGYRHAETDRNDS